MTIPPNWKRKCKILDTKFENVFTEVDTYDAVLNPKQPVEMENIEISENEMKM